MIWSYILCGVAIIICALSIGRSICNGRVPSSVGCNPIAVACATICLAKGSVGERINVL